MHYAIDWLNQSYDWYLHLFEFELWLFSDIIRDIDEYLEEDLDKYCFGKDESMWFYR